MHDAVLLEARGVPAALVVTEPFVAVAERFAPTVGAPDYPCAAVPHPISSVGDDELRKYAARVADEVADLLTTP
ncbi:MAG: hypothetical protein F4004_02195 [Acidimicrobiia bacterium]|nr:hypothetical protein [Acidimicrobiia bacterium]MYC46168.1 hypothetical protein [Acidimicrobiia bacterium]